MEQHTIEMSACKSMGVANVSAACGSGYLLDVCDHNHSAVQAVPARFSTKVRLSRALDLTMFACTTDIHMFKVQ